MPSRAQRTRPPETSLSTAPTRTRSSDGRDVQVVTASKRRRQRGLAVVGGGGDDGLPRSRRGRFAATRAFGRGASARALSSRATLRLEARREARRAGARRTRRAYVMNAAGCDHARAKEASRLSFSIGADFERISVANASESSWSFARSASDAGSVGAISPGAGSRVMGSRRANASPLDGRGGGTGSGAREENDRGPRGVGPGGSTEGKDNSPLGPRFSVVGARAMGCARARSAG